MRVYSQKIVTVKRKNWEFMSSWPEVMPNSYSYSCKKKNSSGKPQPYQLRCQRSESKAENVARSLQEKYWQHKETTEGVYNSEYKLCPNPWPRAKLRMCRRRPYAAWWKSGPEPETNLLLNNRAMCSPICESAAFFFFFLNWVNFPTMYKSGARKLDLTSLKYKGQSPEPSK